MGGGVTVCMALVGSGDLREPCGRPASGVGFDGGEIFPACDGHRMGSDEILERWIEFAAAGRWEPGWGESYVAFCMRRAEEGFATGWRCEECVLLWWPFAEGRRGGAADLHAERSGHSLYIGPASFRVGS